ncbi:MAG: DHHW family protein [Oscillospiraceae bacterium]|nr:DHHW family protein [Oscillospiraceae bacterium]
MNQNIKSIITVSVMSALVFGFSAWNILGKDKTYSESERRELAAFPELTQSTLLDGSFMTDFESYALDTFPMRDTFRGIKSAAEIGLFQKLETNGLYIRNGYVSKEEYPYNEQMLDHAAERMRFIYDSFIADKNLNVYFSVIPDKNCFLAEKIRPALDYDDFIKEARKRTDYMQYIDITDLLELDDFYRTDTHWKQEKIVDVAKRLTSEMGVELTCDFTEKVLDTPFEGVYYGQIALPLKADEIHYLSNDAIENCRVTSYSKGKPEETVVYNMKKADGKDPYEIFLSGAEPLIVIENPDAKTDKELVIFRDSFGSSLAPLLVDSYSKIIIADIRYMQSAAVGSFIKFDKQDVLFIYSTLILNNSLSLR